MASGAQAGFPKFAVALTRRGSPTHHIWYSAYPGESVSIEPAVPNGGPPNCTFNGAGRSDFSGCQWVGLGLAPIGWLGPDDGTCYTEPATWKKGGACGSDADCGGSAGSCHRNGVECTGGVDAPLFGACKYYVTINGLRFQHWNHWDKRLNATTRSPPATGGPWGDEVPARLSYYAVELNRAQGTPSQITIQHCEFTDNTNVIFTQQRRRDHDPVQRDPRQPHARLHVAREPLRAARRAERPERRARQRDQQLAGRRAALVPHEDLHRSRRRRSRPSGTGQRVHGQRRRIRPRLHVRRRRQLPERSLRAASARRPQRVRRQPAPQRRADRGQRGDLRHASGTLHAGVRGRRATAPMRRIPAAARTHVRWGGVARS